ncbi:MAG: hypothetical protein MJ119_03420 [Lachnospiraceae bacterium]|nr:hypothetical protein [Lachnospiraceae bacterium]
MSVGKIYMAVLSVLFLFLVFPLNAFASEEETTEQLTDGTVQELSEFGFEPEYRDMSFTFDSGREIFVGSVDGEEVFTMNVPPDSIVSSGVKFDSKDCLMIMVYRDGDVYVPSEENMITSPGRYRIELIAAVKGNDKDLIFQGQGGMFSSAVSFRILPDKVCDLGCITAPKDFRIESVTLDGKRIDTVSEYNALLTADGEYSVLFTGTESDVSYTTDFEKDTIAPFLIFDKSFDGKRVKAPLSISPSEKDTEMSVFLEGNQLIVNEDVLFQPGRYQVTISDKAGNSRNYSFYIIREYKFFSWPMIPIAAGIIIVIYCGMIYVRRNMYDV